MKLNIILPIAIVLSIGLGLIQCVMSNNLSDTGKRVHAIEQEMTAIRDENTMLVDDIASASSVLAVREKAAAMGFSDKKLIISIRDTGSVALGTLPR
jgi:hypothetical protein